MSSEDRQVILAAVTTAISNQDAKGLGAALSELEMSMLGLDEFPGRIFDELLGWLSSQELLGMEGAFLFIKEFKDDARLLSQGQKERLVSRLVATYSSFSDSTAPFVISEIIPLLFPDEKGLASLQSIAESATGTARQLVPHGFKCLVEKSGSAEMQKIALSALEQLRRDAAPEVRCEAETAFKVLEYKKQIPR